MFRKPRWNLTLANQGSIQKNFYSCISRVYLLFGRLKTKAEVVNYTCKSFTESAPHWHFCHVVSSQANQCVIHVSHKSLPSIVLVVDLLGFFVNISWKQSLPHFHVHSLSVVLSVVIDFKNWIYTPKHFRISSHSNVHPHVDGARECLKLHMGVC